MTADYQRPAFLFNAHLETIFPAILRRVSGVRYERERIITPDNDFLDLDWLTQKSNKLVIISHGLEGNTERAYMKGMAHKAFSKGFDVLTWNFRGCSGEVNKQLRFYHSGATDDMDVVVKHALAKGYTEINLIGFSLGANVTLKYLGERLPLPQLKRAVAISVPLDLHTSCIKISAPGNRVYARRFLNSLTEKVKRKAALRSELDTRGIDNLKTLIEFDDRYTAPLHGFRNAVDYYKQCSSLFFLEGIRIPTLIVNAQNDPFLSEHCYPEAALKGHTFVIFEAPRYGGHVGFAQFHKNGVYWSEERALAFLTADTDPTA